MAKPNIYLQKQNLTVSSENVNYAKDIVISFDIDEDRMTLYNKKGNKNFCFTNSNDLGTLEYWTEILKCMQLAINYAKKNLNVDRNIKM